MLTKSLILNIVAFAAGLIAVFTTIAVVLMIVNKTLDESTKGGLAIVIIVGFLVAIGSRFAAGRLSHY